MTETSILVVEGETSVASDLASTLQKLGYAVPDIIHSGEMAVRKAAEIRPDLVLMDIKLPGEIDSVEAASQIRARLDIPVVYLTAYADEETLQRAKVTEPFGYILKPFRVWDLRSNIEIALYRHAMERKLRESEHKYRSIVENSSDAIVLTDKQGNIIEWNAGAILLDITERQRMEEALRRARDELELLVQEHTAQLETLRQTGLELAAELDLNTLLNSIVSHAVALTGGAAGSIGLWRPESDVLEWVVASDPDQSYSGTSLRRGEGLAGRVWETGEPLIVNDCAHWEGHVPAYARYGWTAIVGAPIYWGKEFLGVLEVEDKAPHTFSHADVRVLEMLTAQAAIAIHNARLYEQIRHELGERQQAEEAVRRAERRYRDLFEEAPIMYVITRNQGGLPVIEDCNQMFQDTLGYSCGELQGRLLTDFYTPESRAKLLDGGYQRALNGHFEAEERAWVTRDGRVIQTLLTTRPEVDADGRVTGTRAMCLNITARKQVEQALEESEQRFRRLAENAPDAIYRYEFVPQLHLTYASPATKIISGYSPEELYADVSLALDMVHPEDRSLLTSALQRPIGSGEPIVVRWVRKDGTIIWTEHRQVHVYDPAGRLVAVEGIARDITQRRWAEQALQESEERYRRRSTELVALHGISLHLNALQDLSDLLRLVVEQAVTLLEASAGGIYLYDEQQDVLTFAIGTGYAAEFVGRTLKPGEGLAGRVFASRQSMTVADYATWPGRAAAFDGDTRLKAQLAVPLLITQTVLGVLTIHGADGMVFGEHDIWLVEMFASQVAVAFENVRLHAETQRRSQLLAALNKAGRAMSSTLGLESVLSQVIEEVRSLLGAEGVSIILRDPTNGELVFAAAAGQGSQELIGARIPINTGIAGWVMRERQSALVHDAQSDPRFWNAVDIKTNLTTRSLVAVPLKFKASVWGVIEAINRTGGRFDKLDLEMLEALASSAAIAIENARLYEAEKEQRRLVEQSQFKLAESEKLAATGRLAATLAHEINNPLQAISNSMQLMLNFDLEPDERRECIQLASTEVERLAGIVSRTLDFARRPQAEMKPASLNQTVEKVLALAGKYLQHRHIALEQNLAPDLLPIRANPDELAQVFLNLVLNAVDAMPESGTLRVTTGSAGEGFMTAAFSDTGCGIAPENLEHIFEPFFTTKSGGTGLGLSVSASVVSRHSGKITVQSQVNQGTTFTVWLPAATR